MRRMTQYTASGMRYGNYYALQLLFLLGRVGKLVNGIDVCKFGKQWVVSIEAMKREYGNAGDRV